MERGDEQRPPPESDELADIEVELEVISFPATGSEIVESIGDREIEFVEDRYRIAELVPDSDEEIFDSPDAVRVQIQQPTVAAAMKRILEASAEIRIITEFSWTQRKAYEKTFEELKAIDADDEDEGIQVIRDWIVERIHKKEQLPSSRAVRREAAKFCRANGYQVRNDEWLGI